MSGAICGSRDGQASRDVIGGVAVVDVVNGDLCAAVADHLGDLIDHRRMRLGGGADPLGQNQPAVDVDAQQRLQRQRGTQPRRSPADPAAAPQVVQPVHDDERVTAGNRRTRGGLNGVEVRAGGGRPRGGQRDEPDAHRGRPEFDHPHRRTEVAAAAARN